MGMDVMIFVRLRVQVSVEMGFFSLRIMRNVMMETLLTSMGAAHSVDFPQTSIATISHRKRQSALWGLRML
jgi:hypothetical protein